MEQLVNNSTVYTQLNIASQDAQFCPVFVRKDLDIELIITDAQRPIKLIIDACVAH